MLNNKQQLNYRNSYYFKNQYNHNSFLNVYKLVQAEMTVPISFSTCEYFFSAMGRLEKLVTHQYESRKIYQAIYP